MQAIIDACQAGTLAAEPRVVISNNSQSGALARARQANIAAFRLNERQANIAAFHLSKWQANIAVYHLSERTHGAALGEEILAAMQRHEVEVICLAGYMKKLGTEVLTAYEGRILNIHPALLPKFGGQGMYGMRVHEAVLAAGERESGATVHLVDEEYDHGQILAQEKVPVKAEDTPETLQKRVLAAEHRLYAATLARIAAGEIPIPLPRPRA